MNTSKFLHVPRSKSASTGLLAKLASSLVLPKGEPDQVQIEEIWLLPLDLELIPPEYDVHHVMAYTTGDDDWRKPFLDYFNNETLPSDTVERHRLQRRLPSYIVKEELCTGVLLGMKCF